MKKMKKLMTKEAAIEFKKRWVRVNEAEKRELRRIPLSKKIFQLVVLTSSTKVFVLRHSSQTVENNKVMSKWNRLREAYING